MFGVDVSRALELEHPAYVARRRIRARSECAALFDALDAVMDPELPVLTLWELGVLKDIRVTATGIEVAITPTYTACPAIEVMEQDIRSCLERMGYVDIRVIREVKPPWSTDWLSAEARRTLLAYGVAPPEACICPQCFSDQVQCLSEFGSTSCKAQYRCRSCGEPFDYFKPLR